MKTIVAVLALAAVAAAQDTPAADRVTVPFSDPSRPRTVKGHLLNGCFSVEGYDGAEVVVEGRGAEPSRRRPPRGAEGMHRIDPSGSGLTIEEESNTITIRSAANSGNVLLRVPRTVTLKLECTNGGDMKVANITGDLELNNLNGNITASNVSGSVLGHSLNGKVAVLFDRVTPDKPMSFSTLNGDIDVTLPPDTKATVKMKSDNGEIYSDFDVKLSPNASQPVVEDSRGKGGKYRVKIDRTTVGTINGGGPEMTFKTLNGNIFMRQRK